MTFPMNMFTSLPTTVDGLELALRARERDHLRRTKIPRALHFIPQRFFSPTFVDTLFCFQATKLFPTTLECTLVCVRVRFSKRDELAFSYGLVHCEDLNGVKL